MLELSYRPNILYPAASGVVINSTLNGMPHQARQAKLNAILANGLTVAVHSAVGAIAALMPAEATVKAN